MKPKQEQIDEMAKVIQKIYITKISRNEYCLAQDIYEAGYRKASDVIDEFVERLKAKESPKLLTWEYGEGYSDCIKIAEQIVAEMRQEVEK
jgi:hypothetical protein